MHPWKWEIALKTNEWQDLTCLHLMHVWIFMLPFICNFYKSLEQEGIGCMISNFVKMYFHQSI
jgi:hypothetical protein